MENIKITLETLYDILRNEKKREDLQKLEETFFIDVISYLKEKQTFLATKKDDDDLFASGEKDKLEYEIRSIKRILKEIYEKREKKILDIALNKSRTGSEIIDTSAMLKEEKEFYGQVLKVLDDFRRGILLNLFKGELPSMIPEIKKEFEDTKLDVNVTTTPTLSKFEEGKGETELEKKQELKLTTPEQEPTLPLETKVESEQETTSQTPLTQDQATPQAQSTNTVLNEDEKAADLKKVESELSKEETSNETTENKETKEEPTESQQEMTKIKMIKAMPSFVWKDMKVYGPYEINDEVEIFPEVAELMIRKGRAEKV